MLASFPLRQVCPLNTMTHAHARALTLSHLSLSLSPDADDEAPSHTIIKRFAKGAQRNILLIRPVEPTLCLFTDGCSNEDCNEEVLSRPCSEAEVCDFLGERGPKEKKPLVICCENPPLVFSGVDFLSSTHRYVAVYPPCVCLAMCSDPTCRHARLSCREVCPDLHCECSKCEGQRDGANLTFPGETGGSEATS